MKVPSVLPVGARSVGLVLVDRSVDVAAGEVVRWEALAGGTGSASRAHPAAAAAAAAGRRVVHGCIQ